jgi:hypothetical protein
MNTLTPGHQNELIDSQQAKGHIEVLPNIVVNTNCNVRLLFERAFQIQDFRCEWPHSLDHSEHQLLSTTQDKRTIVKHGMDVLRPF